MTDPYNETFVPLSDENLERLIESTFRGEAVDPHEVKYALMELQMARLQRRYDAEQLASDINAFGKIFGFE